MSPCAVCTDPICFAVARSALFELKPKWADARATVTKAILAVLTACGLLISDVGFVVSFIGGTLGRSARIAHTLPPHTLHSSRPLYSPHLRPSPHLLIFSPCPSHSAIIYIFPALLYLATSKARMADGTPTALATTIERWGCRGMAALGVILGVLGGVVSVTSYLL